MVKKTVKIQDVAKFAGVSTATISRALSNPDLVSEMTRKTVLDAVKATGYRVNRAARNLRTQRANAVLVLLPDIGNPFFSQILQGIESVLSPAHFSILVAETGQISACGEQLVDYFDESRVDGMILFDGSLDRQTITDLAATSQSKKIVCACEWIEGSSFPSIRSANRRGTEAAIKHLYELGHRKIAHVSGPLGNVLTGARRDSAIEVMTRLGIPPSIEYLIEGDFNLNSGRSAAKTILEMRDPPTAVFCASDQIAYGLIAELTAGGVNVPQDVSVVGFDDIELSEHFIPALTTMRQDRHGLGKRAASMLMSRINEEASDSLHEIIVMDVELIERHSSAAVPL